MKVFLYQLIKLLIFQKTMEELDVKDNDIEGIILVGGSTRCNLIKERLKENFNTSL